MSEALLLEREIGQEAFKTVAADPAAFVRTFDGREPFDHQSEAMRAVVKRGPDGRFSRRVWVVSWPRQNGKSQTSAWLGSHQLFTSPDCRLIVTVALDRESARIIFDAAKQLIEGNEILRGLVDPDWGITRNEVRLRDGRRWIIRSADGRLSRGLSPDVVLEDEAGWTKDDGDLHQTLQAGQAARPNPLTVVTSTVSPVKFGVLWDLFSAAERHDPTVGLLYRKDNPSPMVTDQFLAEQAELLPPTIFAREHKNEWIEGGDAYATEDDWKRATSRGDPTRASSEGPSFAFLDVGLVHDPAVLAICQINHELDCWDVIHLATWKGSQKNPIHLPTVRDTIKGLIPIFGIKALEIESWQGISMAQDLGDIPGVEVSYIHATNLSNAERYGALYRALKEGRHRLPPEPMLRRQLLTMTIKQTGSGGNWKIEDLRGIHNDYAIAVAGAFYLGLQHTYQKKWRDIPFLAMTDDGPVRGPNLEPIARGELFIPHRPGVRQTPIPLPISGTEIRNASEMAEIESWSPGRRTRICQRYLELMTSPNRKPAEAHSMLARQFGCHRNQIKHVLSKAGML